MFCETGSFYPLKRNTSAFACRVSSVDFDQCLGSAQVSSLMDAETDAGVTQGTVAPPVELPSVHVVDIRAPTSTPTHTEKSRLLPAALPSGWYTCFWRNLGNMGPLDSTPILTPNYGTPVGWRM